MHNIKISFKIKALIPIIIVFIASMLVISVIDYKDLEQVVQTKTNATLGSYANNIITQTENLNTILDTVSQTLDQKNIAMAHSITVMLEKAEITSDELKKLTQLMGIIELNVVDKNGIIEKSNFDDYIGFDYNSAESTKIYMGLVSSSMKELSEAPRTDEISGNTTQYVGVSRIDDIGFIQMGFDADVFRKIKDELNIQNLIEQTKIGNNGYGIIISNGIISAHPDTNILESDVSGEDWYKAVNTGEGFRWININGTDYYTVYKNTGEITTLGLVPEADYYSELRQTLNSTIIFLSVAIILMIAVVYLILGGLVAPIKKLSHGLDKIANGNLNVSVATNAKDEIGQLSRDIEVVVKQSADYIKDISYVLTEISKGNLDLKLDGKYIGDFNIAKKAIDAIITKLNEIIGNIMHSTNQVSGEAKHICDSSHTLTSGSTEQSNAIQQLTSSITDIALKTTDNAKMAERATDLAEKIKENAEKGNRQMDEMMSAVNEINEASKSISNVIKVIDEIAFQTNILALNAAVEAARAGEHGKGFAVVAEEVRNLAFKSAEAAKDTGNLITNSIEKADLGARIAGETAASLSEIVSGIGESSLIISEIAKSSEEQSKGIVRINEDISQVGQIVSQNSVTAIESATASEEMKRQSEILEESISQFKLRNDTDLLYLK